MTRLFVSLYAMIILGLLTIGWLSEQAWRQFNAQSDQEIQQLAQLTRLLPELCQQSGSSKEMQQHLSELLHTQVQRLETGDVYFSEAQSQLIAQERPVITYTQSDQLIIYQAVGDVIFEIGPLLSPNRSSGLKHAFQLASYLLLALVIAAWTWPLWRDLRALQQAAQSYGQGQFNHSLAIRESSAISPLAKSFSAMAEQISTLLVEQKQLVNAVSHDLRTPLSRIRFSLAMLSPEVQQHLPEMKQDLDELERLVDELLSYARLEHQTNKLQIERVDIHQLLTHQVEKFNRQTELEVQLAMTEPLHWHCDGHLLERAIQNLLSNAIKFAYSQVLVTVQVENSTLELCVQDDGDGIPESAQRKVFEAFARLENGPANTKGFGLGLAIVKKIVEWHGGSCLASQASLGGAQLTLKLPALHHHQMV